MSHQDPTSKPRLQSNCRTAATQVGLIADDIIDAANVLRDKLTEQFKYQTGLNAAMKTLAVKCESPSGIEKADITPLADAIAEAKGGGVDADAPEFVAAAAALKKAEAQLVVQAKKCAAARAAKKRPSRETLKEAVDPAKDFARNLTLQASAKAELKEFDAVEIQATPYTEGPPILATISLAAAALLVVLISLLVVTIQGARHFLALRVFACAPVS